MGNSLKWLGNGIATLLSLGTALTISATASAQSRIFDLHLQNGLKQSISVIINGTGHNCYEGTPGVGSLLGPLRPGERSTVRLARVQGHGCDGEQGVFQIQPTYGGNEMQGFSFDNSGHLFMTNMPTSYVGKLSRKSTADESYTWSILPNSERLSGAIDASFTRPINPIASDAGTWGLTSRIERFPIQNQPALGLWGNFYDDCVGYELFHPQHVVRLPNKNGHAYFMVAQSRAHNGWISVLKTNPGQLDPVTDAVKPNDGSFVGKYIWQDLYKDNPVGNWNHPGKMDVIGDILIVAAQNWAEGAPCFYGAGSSVDKVLFYDVRDPELPVYWGAITASEFGVPEISTAAIVRTPDGTYLLNAGGDGTYTTWEASAISPKISDWKRLSTPEKSFSGQHGMNFSSYQNKIGLPGSVDPAGTERIMYFDSSGERDTIAFSEFKYNPSDKTLLRSGGYARYSIDLPGANRDWDSDSLYVSANGVPIIYSMESAKGDNGALFQIVNGD